LLKTLLGRADALLQGFLFLEKRLERASSSRRNSSSVDMMMMITMT
jgi:hypothetical protein